MVTETINVTDLRNNLQEHLNRVQNGEPLAVTSRGKIIVRIVPPGDQKELAKARLKELRTMARVGDVETPLGEFWDAEIAHP